MNQKTDFNAIELYLIKYNDTEKGNSEESPFTLKNIWLHIIHQSLL